MPWQAAPAKITRQSFVDLLENRIPYIEINYFFSPEQCKTLEDHLLAVGLTPAYIKDDPEPHSFYMFDTHYRYEQKTPEEYFPKARIAIDNYEKVCTAVGINPAKLVIKYLRDQANPEVSIAEQEGQLYTYAMVRALKREVFIHADFAQFLADYWSINKITTELAWNIYLTDPGKGGECVVYNRPWEREDDVNMIPDTYGYYPKVVEGCESVSIPITPGKLLFFNSRNFHKVNQSENLRLSFGGHIGLTPDKKMLMWI